jgi:hypothetical protein
MGKWVIASGHVFQNYPIWQRVAQDTSPPLVFVSTRGGFHDDLNRHFEGWGRNPSLSVIALLLLPETIEPNTVLTLSVSKGKITPDSECDLAR